MSFIDWFQLVSALLIATFVVYRNTAKGRFWKDAKRSFQRRPLLNIILTVPLICAFALVLIPPLRPEWLTENADYLVGALAVGIILLALFATWDFGKAEKDWRRREDSRPMFEDEAKQFKLGYKEDQQI